MAIRIKNSLCEWRIGEDGSNLGFYDGGTGINHLYRAERSCCAYVRKGGWRAEACAATYADGVLTLRFAGGAGMAVIDVAVHEGYFVFTVREAEGDFDELCFINIPTLLSDEADQLFSASAIALSLLSNVEELPGPQCHLWTACYRRFGFQGAQTGLVASSFEAMRGYMKEMVSGAPGVPHSPLCGPWAQDAEWPTYSNVMQAPTLATAPAWIDFCHRLGIKAIEFNGTLDYGSYLPRPAAFPGGFADVRRLVDLFHREGILCGLHTMSFSIAKNCSWVTPKPDPRLAKERTYTLAEVVSATDETLPLCEDTSDLPSHIDYLIRRSMTLQIDDELIVYKVIKTTAPYAVMSCQRGACGTVPAAHAAGAPVHHLKECWGCFAPDGESTLFGEVADRISTAVNECDFDFVYLDGLDGSHIIGGEEARWHYGAKFTFEVFRGLKRPIMMEMATFHHHLWYVRTRMQAWDHAKRAFKAFTDLHVFSNSFARKMFMPLHLGWFGLFPYVDHQTDMTFWDDVEYLWSKALGTDANYTLQQVSPASLTNGAWLAGVASTIEVYERLRREHHFGKTVQARLAKAGDEYRLCPLGGDRWAFQPIQAETHQITDEEGITDGWRFCNRFDRQKLAVRIEARPSVGGYDTVSAVTLADFSEAGAFAGPGETVTILNSGKLYRYPDHAPGVSCQVVPCDEDGVAGRCGLLKASQEGDGLIPSSQAGDRFSLEDHFERVYELQEATWGCLRHSLGEIDLTAQQGLGLWVKGDGQGEVLDISLTGQSHSVCSIHHFLKIDFTGWRYCEFCEPDVRFDENSWPFARCHYSIYRGVFNYKQTRSVDLWVNTLPKGGSIEVRLGALRALPLVNQPLVRPVIAVNGQKLQFPVSLMPGQYLEYFGDGEARVYDGVGNYLGSVQPEGAVPELVAGDNEVHFSCRGGDLRTRARVTLFTKSDELFGDENSNHGPAWGRGNLVSPQFGELAVYPEGTEAPAESSFLAP